ncbi:MAG TPA: hypothetical protein DCG19_15190 [Cryomorphaceae bacterium]|nr:hypothetical protein [Cryomorphaceae bacterium]
MKTITQWRFYTFISLLLTGPFLYAQPCLYKYVGGSGHIQQVYEATDSTIWVATTRGVFRMDDLNSPVVYDPILPSAGNAVPVFKLVEADGYMWAATEESGIFRYDGFNWLNFAPFNGLPSSNVNDITVDGNDRLWVATDKGIAMLDATGVNFNIYTPFSNNDVWAIGANGTDVYASSRSQTTQIMYFDGTAWNSVPDNSTNIAGRRVNQLKFDTAGTMYTLALGGVLSQYKDGVWSTLPGNALDFTIDGTDLYFLSKNTQNYLIRKRDTITDTLQAEICLSGQSSGLYSSREPGSFWLGGEVAYTNYVSKTHISSAESYGTLAVNGIKAGFYKGGDLFLNPEGEEFSDIRPNVPGGPGYIYTSNLWVKGSSGGNEKVSAATYALLRDFNSGPVSGLYDSDYIHRYDRVWKVNKAQIADFKANYNTPGYSIPEAILNWPGNGDVLKGEAPVLAPFEDLNNNGIYEPYMGEYPYIKGDEAIYFIINDTRGLSLQTESVPVGVEIHCMAYAFDTTDEALANTIFLGYRIFNRSGTTLTNFKTGFWSDFDLGAPWDDRVGCDSRLNLMYSYNGDSNDEGPLGFGAFPPASGILFLSDSLRGTLNYLSYSLNGPDAMHAPENAANFINYMDQKWLDGSLLRLENPSGPSNNRNGDGYDPMGSYPATNFHFNDKDQWFQPVYLEGDMRSLGVGSEVTLQDNESYCFEIAFFQARDQSSPDFMASLNLLKSRAADLRSFYAANNEGCLENVVSLREETKSPQAFIYPNPARTRLFIREGEELAIQTVRMFTMNGVKLKDITREWYSIDIAELPTGVYLVQLQFEDGTTSVQKIMKE